MNRHFPLSVTHVEPTPLKQERGTAGGRWTINSSIAWKILQIDVNVGNRDIWNEDNISVRVNTS